MCDVRFAIMDRTSLITRSREAEVVIILMGVMGSGKTTIGRKLALALACPFHDADDLHPPQNREKMARGIPLDDRDREPWLRAVADSIRRWEKEGPLTVLACSALKRAYRDLLSSAGRTRWVHLKGEVSLVRERLKGREGHFADPGILDRQFEDLEEPQGALTVDIRQGPDTMTAAILEALKSWKG
jgi:carbohydrate kinase (thermoresistant glucokinase family)